MMLPDRTAPQSNLPGDMKPGDEDPPTVEPFECVVCGSKRRIDADRTDEYCSTDCLDWSYEGSERLATDTW